MMIMKKRDLANCNNSPVCNIVNIGASYKKKSVLKALPDNLRKCHENRTIWIHDLEYYESTYNCIGLNPSDLIEKDVCSFSSACRSLFRGIVELTNSQSGGIGFIDFDSDMAQYIVDESDKQITEELYQLLLDLNIYVRKGCEMAYVTFNFGLCTGCNGRRISKALLSSFSRKQFIFPNLVFKVKKGINRLKNDTNYDIYCQASKITALCMNPTYLNMDAEYNKDIPENEFGIMGCRTRVASNLFHNTSSLKRGNIAAVTINLVQLAIKSNNNPQEFDNLLFETMCSAKTLLLHRFHTLCQKGCFDYICKHNLYIDCENSDTSNFLKNGTLSIGFIGLWDAILVLYNLDAANQNNYYDYFNKAYAIVQKMRKITNEFSEKEKLNYSLLASSAEGVSGYFYEHDSNCFDSKLPVFSKGHYTNSFHIPVSNQLSCFEKISLEAPFHKLCNGGHITYIELNEIPFGNSEAIRELVDFACEHDIGYFGINFPLDICNTCGEKGLFVSKCKRCGSTDIKRLRRVSGYLSEIENFAFGKKSELTHRKPNTNFQEFKINDT